MKSSLGPLVLLTLIIQTPSYGEGPTIQELIPRIDKYSTANAPSDPTLKRVGETASADASTSQSIFNTFIEKTIKYDEDLIERKRYPNGRTYTTTEDDGKGGTKTVVHHHKADEVAAEREKRRQREVDSRTVQNQIESNRGGKLREYDAKYGADRSIANDPNQWSKMSETRDAAKAYNFQNQQLNNTYQNSTQIGDETISVGQQTTPGSAAQKRSYAQAILSEAKAQANILSKTDKTPGAGTSTLLNQTLLQSTKAGENARGNDLTLSETQKMQTLATQTANQTMSHIKRQAGISGKDANLKAGQAALTAGQIQSLSAGAPKKNLAAQNKNSKDQSLITDPRLASKTSFAGSAHKTNGWDTDSDGKLDRSESSAQTQARNTARAGNAAEGWGGAAQGDETDPLPSHQDFNSQDTQNLSASDKLQLAQQFRKTKNKTPLTSTHMQGRRYSQQKNADGSARTFADTDVANQIAERQQRRSTTEERILYKGTPQETRWERSGLSSNGPSIHSINESTLFDKQHAQATQTQLLKNESLAPAGVKLAK